MLMIPGIIISVLTFPGVMVHEFAHHLFCRIRKVPVYEAVYFQLDWNVQGYVSHGKPKDFASTLLISAGPLFVNTILCMAICFPAALPYYYFGESSILTYFLLWLGVSIGMHAFPSNADAQHIWEMAKKEVGKRNPLAIISFPIVGLIYIANALSVLWFDAIYGFFIGIMLPAALFNFLMFI